MHDYFIDSYSVDFIEKMLILNISSKGKKKCVCFKEVLTHCFNGILQYNQIMDIEEATVKNFIKENSQRIKELRLYDWPVLYETIEELERILYESQYKYIKIYSSYGLEGWVLAKKVEIVDGNQ